MVVGTHGIKNQTNKQTTSQQSAQTSAAVDNTDYKALMDKAAQSGDYVSAAQYEQKRNAKIDAMNASGQNPNNYSKSSLYSQYLNGGSTTPQTNIDKTDYKALMDQAAAAGDFAMAAQYEQQRNAKIDAMNAAGQNPNNYGKSSLYSAYLPRENAFNADMIKNLYAQMQQQQNAAIDYNVNKAVAELQRAQEDAQKQFEQQRNQVNVDEAQSRDKQVLYAAARGDRGGITARQYDSISNTAANNRRAIAQQQQQLATDTARQIADLRAQGEFEKANAVLQVAQQQLAQLWELQQYEDQMALTQQEMAMNQAALTGNYLGQKTYEAQMAEKQWDYETQQNERQWAYEIAMQSIQAGIVPDDSTIAAAGLTKDFASQMAKVYKAAMVSKSSGSAGSGSGSNKTTPTNIYDRMYADGVTEDWQAREWLIRYGHTSSEVAPMVEDYIDYYLPSKESQNTVDESDLGTYVDGTFVTWDDLETFVNRGTIHEYVKNGKNYYSWTKDSYSY